MIIGVASENTIKINAVKNVFSNYFNQSSNNIIKGFYSESGINEQPINDETLIGARNRIKYLLENNKNERLDFIVAIENGVFNENNKHYDLAVVIIYDINYQIIFGVVIKH